jgi:hypothetical protein
MPLMVALGGVLPLTVEKKMQMSEQIGQLAKALSQAQKKFPKIVKDKVVKTNKYTFTYAELEQIIDKTKDVLAENGLSISQLVGTDTLTTILMHESGEFLMESAEIPRGQYDQQIGASITYRRRYAQVAILNVSAEDDVDGEDGEGDKEVGGKEAVDLINSKELQELQDLIPSNAELARILEAYQIKTLRDLPFADFESCKKRLLKRGK